MLRGKACKPGDKVRLLHEKGEGIVVKNTTEFLYVDIGDGFELPVLHNDVIIIEQTAKVENQQENNQVASVIENQRNISESVPVPKPVRKHVSDTTKGIYLAFAPVKQDILLTGDVRVYLINYTRLSGFYALFTQTGQSFEIRYKGEMEDASATVIDTIDRKNISEYRKGIFQCVFTNTLNKGVASPFYTHLEIKPERFLNEEMYTMNQTISMFALTVQLMRFDELRWIQTAFGKDYSGNDVIPAQSEIIEKKSIISKFQTAPGEAEVDLHIDTLMGKSNNIDDTLKLKKQLDVFRQCLDSAMDNNFHKVIFIHGVGVGVLKMEIQRMLKGYDNVQFRDAPISRYGIGATEVIISKSK